MILIAYGVAMAEGPFHTPAMRPGFRYECRKPHSPSGYANIPSGFPGRVSVTGKFTADRFFHSGL